MNNVSHQDLAGEHAQHRLCEKILFRTERDRVARGKDFSLFNNF